MGVACVSPSGHIRESRPVWKRTNVCSAYMNSCVYVIEKEVRHRQSQRCTSPTNQSVRSMEQIVDGGAMGNTKGETETARPGLFN